jgi:DNA-binding response OmpR family regulator
MKWPAILIVDGSATARTAIESNLEKRYEVVCVESGNEALGILKTRCIHLAIVEAALKDAPGINLAQKLKEDYLIPVIVTAAYSTEDTAIKALRAGVDEYIKNPFEVDYLLSRVNQLLDFSGSHLDHPLRAKRYIHRNYHKPLQLSDIAEHIGITERHLCRVFKKTFNASPITYLKHHRMEKAKQILRTKPIPL